MLDEKKVTEIRRQLKALVGEAGAYVLLLSEAAPKTPHDAQVWNEGSGLLSRGLVEIGRDFVIQRGLDSINYIRPTK